MKLVGIEKRRRKPDEMAKLRVSVRNHCLECHGWKSAEVKNCTAPECWLWPWRTGKTPVGYRDLVGDVGGVEEEILTENESEEQDGEDGNEGSVRDSEESDDEEDIGNRA